jgi:hypothetical protein
MERVVVGMISAPVAFGGKTPREILAARAAFRNGSVTHAPTSGVTPGSGRQHNDFAVPFQAFAKSLLGTPDEVWSIHMRSLHGAKSMKFPEWADLLESVKGG